MSSRPTSAFGAKVSSKLWELHINVFYLEGIKRMKERDTRYRILFDMANDGILLFDRTGILDCNPRCTSMFGFARRELIGRTLADLCPERQPGGRLSSEMIDEKIQAALLGETQVFGWKFLGEGGNPTDFEITLNRGSSGQDIYLQAIIRDVTERKQAERMTEQYHSVIHASMDGFWITDTTGRIVDVNNAICGISGYSRAELLNLSIQDIEADETPEVTAAHISEMIEKGHVQFEARHRRKDGAIINVEVSILHVPEFEDRLFCFVRDITERKQAEVELIIAKERAELSSRAKSEFILSMNHELRTPLSVVLGQAELLESEVNESQKNQIITIKQASLDLLKLINQVLDLSTNEAGYMSFDIGPVDVKPVLLDCMHMYKPIAAERGMDMQCECHGVVQVTGDQKKLKQAVLSYLSNAVKYGKEKGAISLVVAETDSRVRISVIDDGEGIPLDRQKDLFTSFNRLGREGSSIRGGGLGLSLTKGVIERMGGKVGVESIPGRGSNFWIELSVASSMGPKDERSGSNLMKSMT